MAFYCTFNHYNSILNLSQMKSFLLFTIFLLFSFVKIDAQELVWAKSTPSGVANLMTTDAAGNLYTAGVFSGTVDFDPSAAGTYTLTSFGLQDIFIAKFDGNGNFIWVKRFGGNVNDMIKSIKVDLAGNIYSSGYFSNTADFDPSVTATYSLAAVGIGYQDAFISKLDANGNFVWAKRFGGGSDDRAGYATVDSKGNVFVTGRFQGTVDLDPSPTGVFNVSPVGGSSYGIFISKFDGNGNFIFGKQLGIGEGLSIKIDALGNIYSAGRYETDSDFDPSPSSTYSLTCVSGLDCYISKLDSLGNFIWAKKIGSNTPATYCATLFSEMEIDNVGNIYCTGSFQGSNDFDPSPTSTYSLPYNSSFSNYKLYVHKLDANGNFLWANKYGPDNASALYPSLVLDADNNVYSVSYFTGTCDFDPSPTASYTLSSGCGSAVFISVLNSSGNFLWARHMKEVACANSGTGESVALDGDNSIYIGGTFNGPIDFDPSASGVYTLTPVGNFVAKYCNAPKIISTGSSIRCKQGSVTLNATSSSGILNWYSSNSGGPSLGSGNLFVTPSISVTTTYYVEASIFTCKSNRLPVVATINNTTYTSSRNMIICSGSSLNFNNHNYNATGIYKDTLSTALGCDSVVTTNLLVTDTIKVSQTIGICQGENISVGTHSYNTNGNYKDTLTAIGGCDSIVSTNLIVFPISVTNQTITVCAGDYITIGSFNHSVSAIYHDTLATIHGCDSILITDLRILPQNNFNQSLTIYSGQNINVGSYSHNKTGIYNDTLVAANGCDSIVTTNLTVLSYQLADEEWYVIHSIPNSNTLNSIKFRDSNNAIAVGNAGSILKTTNAGNTWENKNVNSYLSLKESFFVNANIGYAVGYNKDFTDAIIKTTDGGNSWIDLSIGYNTLLTSVYFLSQDTGFAVGYFGTILKTVNGGLNWVVVNSGTGSNLNCVFFINSLTGFIVGESGTLLKTTNGGATWQLTTLSGSLKKITFLNSTDGFIVSNDQIFKTINGGANWTSVLYSLNYLNSLHFVNSNIGFATGYYGYVFKTIDGGSSWTTLQNYTNSALWFNSIYFTDVNTGYIAGTGGGIFKTTNAGAQWTDTARVNEGIYQSVCFADTNVAYAVGENGIIRKITNGGATIQQQNSGITDALNAVYFVSKDTGYATGAYNILKTVNGGASWQTKFTNVNINFYGMHFSNSLNGFAVGMGTNGGLIYKTIDGGETWTAATTPSVNPLFSVHFPTTTVGYAVGGMPFLGHPEAALIMKTIDGGVTWSVLNISHSYAFYSVNFINKDTGFVAGRYGYVFKTVNGGATWQQLNPNFMGTIKGMAFSNSTTGYVVGQDGNMAKTTDAGATWGRVFSGTDNFLQSVAFDKTGLGYGVGFCGTLIKNGMASNYDDFSICEGDSIVLNAQSVGGIYPYTTNWSITGNSNAIQVKPTITSAYSYTVTDGAAHFTVGEYTVTVISKPVAPTISGLSGILSSSSVTGNQWLFNGIPINGATAQTLTPLQNGNYSVIVTQNGCFSDTSNVLVVNVTGINGLKVHNELEVYPIPTSQYVFVKNSLIDKHVRISIYDSKGTEVCYKETTELLEKINLANLNSGIYLVKLTNGTEVYYKKIIKE